MEKLVALINSVKIENIVILTGPGINTASGVPDLNSPRYVNCLIRSQSDLYSFEPDSLFDLEVFEKDPRPFWWLFTKSFPTFASLSPTPFHYFIKLLQKHNKLLRCYTQNIDELEIAAGTPKDYVISSHGQFNTCHCTKCWKSHPLKHFIKDLTVNMSNNMLTVESTKFPICDFCGSKFVKPDVVFRHEKIADDFYLNYGPDFEDADLLIIAGADIDYEPFLSLPQKVSSTASRFFIGKEMPPRSAGLRFGKGRDFFIQGDCQEFAMDICDFLGWDSALNSMLAEEKTLGFRWFDFEAKSKKRRIPAREQEEMQKFIFEVQLRISELDHKKELQKAQNQTPIQVINTSQTQIQQSMNLIQPNQASNLQSGGSIQTRISHQSGSPIQTRNDSIPSNFSGQSQEPPKKSRNIIQYSPNSNRIVIQSQVPQKPSQELVPQDQVVIQSQEAKEIQGGIPQYQSRNVIQDQKQVSELNQMIVHGNEENSIQNLNTIQFNGNNKMIDQAIFYEAIPNPDQTQAFYQSNEGVDQPQNQIPITIMDAAQFPIIHQIEIKENGQNQNAKQQTHMNIIERPGLFFKT